jgi:hypothetical protein
MVVMGFAFVPIMIEPGVTANEIGAVFPIEPVMIMIIIDAVPIVSVPGGIGIIRISRIGCLVDSDGYVDLGACRMDC